MLTRKYYQAIAKIISINTLPVPGSENDGLFIIPANLIKDLADYCKTDNPNFDTGRFIEAATKNMEE